MELSATLALDVLPVDIVSEDADDVDVDVDDEVDVDEGDDDDEDEGDDDDEDERGVEDDMVDPGVSDELDVLIVMVEEEDSVVGEGVGVPVGLKVVDAVEVVVGVVMVVNAVDAVVTAEPAVVEVETVDKDALVELEVDDCASSHAIDSVNELMKAEEVSSGTEMR